MGDQDIKVEWKLCVTGEVEYIKVSRIPFCDAAEFGSERLGDDERHHFFITTERFVFRSKRGVDGSFEMLATDHRNGARK